MEIGEFDEEELFKSDPNSPLKFQRRVSDTNLKEFDEEGKKEEIDISVKNESLDTTEYDEPIIRRPDGKLFETSAKTPGVLGTCNEEFLNHPLFKAIREASMNNPDVDALQNLEKLKKIYEVYQNKPDTANSKRSFISVKSKASERTRPST